MSRPRTTPIWEGFAESVVERTEAHAADAAVRFLLDGLAVGSLRELHAHVEAGRAAMLAPAPRGGDAADSGPRGHSNEATSLPAQTAPLPPPTWFCPDCYRTHDFDEPCPD